MTFLELCQAAAVDSGLVSDTNNITATSAQTGRKARIVRAVVQAWEDIQKARSDWLFLRGEFITPLIIGQMTYTPTQLGIDARFRSFLRDQDAEGYLPYYLYDSSIGPSDQTAIVEISSAMWNMAYERGTHDASRPTDYAIVNQSTLAVGPKPDKAYWLNGHYNKSPQVLAADADEPDLPSHHHSVIKWKAIMDLHGADGAFADRLVAQARYASDYRILVDEQTDPLTMGGALA